MPSNSSLLPETKDYSNPLSGHAFEELYPMHVVSVKELMKMREMVVHQDALDQGILTKYTPDMAGKIVGVSHQWLSYTSPDPEGEEHLKILKTVLQKLMDGRWPCVEYYWMYALMFNTSLLKPKCAPLRPNWKTVLPEMYVWLDYVSMPQAKWGASSSINKAAQAAVESIPAYMERCSMLLVLAPPCKHQDTGEMCTYASWRRRGWCRTEVMAAVLAPKDIPMMVCTGANATPFMIPMCDAPRLSVGGGTFSCCTLKHNLNGKVVPCDKIKVHKVLHAMLYAKVETLRLQGRRVEAHYWCAMQQAVFEGLPGNLGSIMPEGINSQLAMAIVDQHRRERDRKSDRTAAESLALSLSWNAKDETQAKRTGVSLLMMAVLADDATAVKELVKSGRFDLNHGLKKTYCNLSYMLQGSTPVMLAMALAGTHTIEALLDAGADPYCTNKHNMDALMMAACKGREDNIAYWLRRFPRWELERKGADMAIPVSAITCVSGLHKTVVLKALFEAGAKAVRKDTWGREGLLLALICTNEDSDEEALKLLLKLGCDPNEPWSSDGKKTASMMKAMRMVSSVSESRVYMELAALEGSTPMHFAAKRGDVNFIRILRKAGAEVNVRNASGQTPLDLAKRFFGDSVPWAVEEALRAPLTDLSPKAMKLNSASHSAVMSHTGVLNFKGNDDEDASPKNAEDCDRECLIEDWV